MYNGVQWRNHQNISLISLRVCCLVGSTLSRRHLPTSGGLKSNELSDRLRKRRCFADEELDRTAAWVPTDQRAIRHHRTVHRTDSAHKTGSSFNNIPNFNLNPLEFTWRNSVLKNVRNAAHNSASNYSFYPNMSTSSMLIQARAVVPNHVAYHNKEGISVAGSYMKDTELFQREKMTDRNVDINNHSVGKLTNTSKPLTSGVNNTSEFSSNKNTLKFSITAILGIEK